MKRFFAMCAVVILLIGLLPASALGSIWDGYGGYTPTVTPEPTAVPTDTPTPAPTAKPTEIPTVVPTAVPTIEPTAAPVAEATTVPTAVPTAVPTPIPTAVPTQVPTPIPTAVPTEVPTPVPTAEPTEVPTEAPTPVPTEEPTTEPVATPSPAPTPTQLPTEAPTPSPAPTPEVTLKPVGPKEDANQVGNHDTTYLPSGQLVDLPGGQTFDTYAAPSESAHAESRDKIITNADKVYVVGTVGDWVLMWCNSEDHNPYYGYVRRSDIQGDLPATYNLQFAGTSAVVLKKATVYEAPNKHTTELTSCDKNTELTYLATTENGNYAYVETRDSSGKAVRGFVPRGSLIVNFRKANPFKVDAKCTQVKPSNNANGYITYYPDNMFDGKQSTCWQFRIKKTKLTDVSATITFSSPTALSVMEVRNGFQKNESTGGDQYPKNSRLQKVKISFKYQGGSKFTDAMEVTLPDTKNWQSLNWGSMVDISNDGLPRENVIAVKIQPQSIYEGNKWPEDVAVAEMTFYQDR